MCFRFSLLEQSEVFTEKQNFGEQSSAMSDINRRSVSKSHLTNGYLSNDSRQRTEFLRSTDSNGARVRLWKWELQQFADETGLEVSVRHFPPGTSKWNKIEHRLFSYISPNWRGKPLISHEVIINLIAATTTTTGLAVKRKLDTNLYPAGVRVSDQ
jgi:hypothetical protein